MVSGKSEGWLRWHRWQAVPIWLSTFQASSGPMCPMTSSQKLTPKPWLISDPKVWQMQPVISSLCRRQIWYPWLCLQRLWYDSEDRDITIKAKNNSRLKSQITFSERLRTRFCLFLLRQSELHLPNRMKMTNNYYRQKKWFHMSWMILVTVTLMCTVPDYRKYGKYLLISVEVRLSLDFQINLEILLNFSQVFVKNTNFAKCENE